MLVEKHNHQLNFHGIEGIIQELKKDKNYKQAIKYGSERYSITQYKINKLKLEEIPELINLVQLNYINVDKENEHHSEKRKNSWLTNQLKMFVWVAICHSYLINKPLQEYKQDDWHLFTDIFTRKTCDDFDFQVKSLFKNYKGNKEKWESEEEILLKTILQDQHLKNKWNQVSRILYFQSNKTYYRSAQKCRQYWFNHLDDKLNKSPWTIDEDLRLVKQLLQYGFKWSKITQVIESTWGYRRTEHMVKNRTNWLCKKYGYKDEKEQGGMKELKRIEKKLHQQKQKQQTKQVQVKIQENIDQKSFVTIETHQIQYKNQSFNELKEKHKIVEHETKLKQEEQSESNKSNFQLESQSYMDSQDSRYQQHKKKHKKLCRPTQINHNHKENFQPTTRTVIILKQPHYTNTDREQSQNEQPNQQNSQMAHEQSSSEEIIVYQHAQQEKPQFQEEQDQIQQKDENQYFDEYNIIEEVQQQPEIDLNEDLKFQHDTHGGKMRQRVTHELAQYFPNNPQVQLKLQGQY